MTTDYLLLNFRKLERPISDSLQDYRTTYQSISGSERPVFDSVFDCFARKHQKVFLRASRENCNAGCNAVLGIQTGAICLKGHSQLRSFRASKDKGAICLHSFRASQLRSFTGSELQSFTASQLHSFRASELQRLPNYLLVNFKISERPFFGSLQDYRTTYQFILENGSGLFLIVFKTTF